MLLGCAVGEGADPAGIEPCGEIGGLDAPGLNRRFRAGGVTVCRLMPMRAIPFEVVCLLGMNNSDCLRR